MMKLCLWLQLCSERLASNSIPWSSLLIIPKPITKLLGGHEIEVEKFNYMEPIISLCVYYDCLL